MSIMSLEALENADYTIEGFQDYILEGLREAVKPTPVSIYDEVGKIGVNTVAKTLKILGFRVERNKHRLDGIFCEPFYQTEIFVGNKKIAITDNIHIWILIESLENLHKSFYASQSTENMYWNGLIYSDYPEFQAELAECSNSIKNYILAATKPRCVDENFVKTLKEAGYTIQECPIMDESCVKCPCICMGEEKVKFVMSDDSQDTIRAWCLRERYDILRELKMLQDWKCIEELLNR